MDMKVSYYSFGEIKIENDHYRKDVLVFSKGTHSEWWRNESHTLCTDDIKKVLEMRPSVLVLGTGTFGMVQVMPEAAELLSKAGIKLIYDTTDKAIAVYNELVDKGENVAGAFHLTC
jgi:hypothetical protein